MSRFKIIKKYVAIIIMCVMTVQLMGCSGGKGDIIEAESETAKEEKEENVIVIARMGENAYSNCKYDMDSYKEIYPACDITVKEYLYGEEYGRTYDEALKMLLDDVQNSDEIDIVCLETIRPERVMGKNLFEDLYTYMDSDDYFSQIKLNESVLELFNDNGSLMAIPATFGLVTLESDESLLGDDNLDLDTFLELIEENQNVDIYNYYSQILMLEDLYMANMSYLVNYSEKTCNFTDGNFEKILEAVSKFSADTDYERYDLMIKLKEGGILFLDDQILGAGDYVDCCYLWGNNVRITGYPSVSGDTIEAKVSHIYAINANSKHKETSWKFIKRTFCEASTIDTSYEEYDWSFSVDMDVLEKELESICLTDSEGNEIHSGNYKIMHYDDGNMLEFSYINLEQKDYLRDVLLSVNSSYVMDYESDICVIIEDEAEAFFNGEKTAKEACEDIQSRAEQVLESY